MKIVIALGGNMISDAANSAEQYEDQLQRIHNSAMVITQIIKSGYSVILTHGNGPQVGSLLLQQQARVAGSVSLPLQILGALTQGQIGVLLQHSLLSLFAKEGIKSSVTVIPTSVLVDGDDPGFSNPTKPVGPFIPHNEIDNFRQEGHQYIETKKGYRRVVASPYPRGIVEIDQIRDLSEKGVVIAGGGGGNPTVLTADGYQLRDAVIDKDRASALLANELGADTLMILTNVDGVYRNFGLADQHFLPTLSKTEARAMIEDNDAAAGSMGPKLEAALDFSGLTIITSPDLAERALKGEAGTWIRENTE